jgi:hypothetical protein
MSDLHIKLKLDVRDDTFRVETDVKRERLKDLLGEVVRSLIGAGQDGSPVEERDIYTVDITIDLSSDAIQIASDCGNKGLETGIIAGAFARIEEDGTLR